MQVNALYKKNETLKNSAVVVDLNHANSSKNHKEQPRIAHDVMKSRMENPALKMLVKGLMIESYLEEGKQDLNADVYFEIIFIYNSITIGLSKILAVIRNFQKF